MALAASGDNLPLAIQTTTPTTGTTVTVANDVSHHIFYSMSPAGTLAALTVNLPTTPYAGQIVYISTSQTITAFTLSAVPAIIGVVTKLTCNVTYAYDGTAWRQLDADTAAMLQLANTWVASQTFNGTANVAPNQTRTGGSSIMTSSLTDTRVLDTLLANTIVWHAGSSAAASGSGSSGSSGAGVNGFWRIQASSATIGSYGWLTPISYLENNEGNSSSSFATAKTMYAIISFYGQNAATNTPVYFDIGQGGTALAASSNPTVPTVISEGWMYQATTGWTPYWYDTSAHLGTAVVDSTVKTTSIFGSPSVASLVCLKFIHVPGTGLALYIKPLPATSWTYIGSTGSPGSGTYAAANGLTIMAKNNTTAEQSIVGVYEVKYSLNASMA